MKKRILIKDQDQYQDFDDLLQSKVIFLKNIINLKDNMNDDLEYSSNIQDLIKKYIPKRKLRMVFIL